MFSLAYSNVSVTLVAFAALIILFLARAIYLLFFSPLSAIPGPWYAAVSDFWILTHVLRLQQCKTVHELFEIYGPVVRIGPNRVVFKDLSTTKSVYSVHKFDKSVYYKSLLTCVSRSPVADASLIHPTATRTTMREFWPHICACYFF